MMMTAAIFRRGRFFVVHLAETRHDPIESVGGVLVFSFDLRRYRC